MPTLPSLRKTAQKKVFLSLPKGSRVVRAPPDLYHEANPLINVMGLIGAWPVQTTRTRSSTGPGDSTEYVAAPWRSKRMVASSVLLALQALHIAACVRSILTQLLSGREVFTECVMLFLHIAYETLPLSIPLLHWPTGTALALYFNDWVHFQTSWLWVTGTPLKFECGRRARVAAWTIVVYSIISCTAHLRVSPHLKLWMVPIYWFSVAQAITQGSLWRTLNTEVVKTSVKLTLLFRQRRQSRRGLTGEAVRGYCMLWLRLRALSQALGNAWGGVILHALLFLMVMSMMSMFGVLSAVQQGQLRLVASTIITAIWGAVIIDWICNQGGRAARSVSHEMLLELLSTPLRTLDSDTSEEVMRFLQVITFKPVRINLKGFVVVNRELATAAAVTITTYIVVLAQLALSTSAEKALATLKAPSL